MKGMNGRTGDQSAILAARTLPNTRSPEDGNCGLYRNAGKPKYLTLLVPENESYTVINV